MIPQSRKRPAMWAASLSLFVSLAGLLGPARPAAAESPVHYTVSLPAPQTQMVELTARFPDVRAATLDIMLPIWRPGLYIALHPAATLRELRAEAGDGRPLSAKKIATSTWRIDTSGVSELVVRYRIYANSIGDRTRHVDDTHAFLSGSSVFVYEPSRRSRPIELRVEAPQGWGVATGLEADESDPFLLRASDYDVLVDSPLEIGLHDRLEFEAMGLPHEIVIWPPGVDYDAEHLLADFRKIVESQYAVFGRAPYERYVFLIHVGAGGGGTEHLNSTIMQTGRASMAGSRKRDKVYRRLLGLVSHEFFHTWNVKQLRPADLQPYDYQAENYTRLLWVAEGTTSYYDDLTLVRTGLITPKRYLDILSGSVATHRDRPGSRLQSLEDASFNTWIQFRRSGIDGVNSTISFYRKGALVSLMLDLHLRAVTDGRVSLDDVMRVLFEEFPLGAGGYTTDDVQRVAERLGGTSLDGFFAHSVRGTEPLPLEDAFEAVGLELVRDARDDDADDDADDDVDEEETADGDADTGSSPSGEPKMRAYLGLDLASNGRVRTVRSDGPAWAAGVTAEDEVVALDGRRLVAASLASRLERYEPGDVVTLHVFRRNELRAVEITLAAREAGRWKLRRADDATDEERAAYEAWIGQPWPDDKPEEPTGAP